MVQSLLMLCQVAAGVKVGRRAGNYFVYLSRAFSTEAGGGLPGGEFIGSDPIKPIQGRGCNRNRQRIALSVG
jgi:hypothetical protein